MSVPPGWQRVRSDRGTASAALGGSGVRYRGYLNLTPRQSEESLTNWASFRPAHHREEGGSQIALQASARGLRFRDGARGSCVQDAYTTSGRTRYVEIACLLAGARRSTVIVAAAQAGAWPQLRPTLERAVSAVRS
jgi:hypothetical protein